jgi:ubiquitin-activating enzyme E1
MVKHINPKIKINAVQNKLYSGTENIFNTKFWKEAGVVVTALDNVEARRYVDEQCVSHGCWLIDSGTLGTKGNTQVVIPFVSESYSSSSDPPEDAIPVCTLKSFPYQPEHCIAWARSIFDDYFTADITAMKSLLTSAIYHDDNNNPTLLSDSKLKDLILRLPADTIPRLSQILTDMNNTITNAIIWSINVFNTRYGHDISKLLEDNPLDKTDEEGIPFWGGSRRVPTSIIFDGSNKHHSDFVISTTKLRLVTLGINRDSINDDDIINTYKNIINDNINTYTNTDDNIQLLITTLKGIDVNTIINFSENLKAEEFEKDDLSLGHVGFVASAGQHYYYYYYHYYHYYQYHYYYHHYYYYYYS